MTEQDADTIEVHEPDEPEDDAAEPADDDTGA